MEHLNWLDYTIITIIAISALISLMRGFIREALSLASWIIAFWVGLTFAKNLSPMLQPYIHSDSVRYGIAFFILFVATLLLGAFVNFLITHLVEKTGLSGTDRLLGVVFGFARGVLLVSIVLLAARMTSFPQDTVWQQSRLIPTLSPVETWLAQYIPKDISQDIAKQKASMTNQLINSKSETAIIRKATSDSKMMQQQDSQQPAQQQRAN